MSLKLFIVFATDEQLSFNLEFAHLCLCSWPVFTTKASVYLITFQQTLNSLFELYSQSTCPSKYLHAYCRCAYENFEPCALCHFSQLLDILFSALSWFTHCPVLFLSQTLLSDFYYNVKL